MSSPPVAGLCPMGCGHSLVLEDTGYVNRVVCRNPACPRPGAADELLHDGEAQHIVTVHADGVTIRHPLHERIDSALDDCTLLYALTVLDPPRVPTGRYRVFTSPDGQPVGFQQLEEF